MKGSTKPWEGLWGIPSLYNWADEVKSKQKIPEKVELYDIIFRDGEQSTLKHMSKPKVFVSGPIQGMELEQSYRKKIGRILLDQGYEPIDPWEREKIVYSTTGEEWWKNVPPTGFIRRDLEDIDRCEMLVAYLPKLSAGTCMELFYAKTRGKTTVVICQLENPSPWIIAHSDILLKSMNRFNDFLKKGDEF